MTLHAAGALFGRIMKVMFPGAIFTGHMAAVTKRISIHIDFSAVWLMTILTYHTCLVHLTLQERSIHIYFFQDLAICKVESLIQEGGPVGIQEGSTMVIVLRGHCPSGMTTGAHLDQLIRLTGDRPAGGDRIGIKDPGGIIGVL
jgi:hypothetical protein